MNAVTNGADEALADNCSLLSVVLFVRVLLLLQQCFNLLLIHLCIQQLPDLVTQLGVLYHMIESRVKVFHKLTKLHGKLYLLMTQVGITVFSDKHTSLAFKNRF